MYMYGWERGPIRADFGTRLLPARMLQRPSFWRYPPGSVKVHP